MDDPNEIMYPQVTPVYVKLLQVGVAVILFFMILNLSVMGLDDSEEVLEQHFKSVAQQHLTQAINTSKLLLVDKNHKQIQAFVDALAESTFVEQAVLYDKQGEVVASSDNHTRIEQLYGVAVGSEYQADQFVPFIGELRDTELYGYLRLNIVKQQLVNDMQQQLYSQFELFRIMLLTALITGFLLTRGLSRFSRHSFRLPIKTATKNSI